MLVLVELGFFHVVLGQLHGLAHLPCLPPLHEHVYHMLLLNFLLEVLAFFLDGEDLVLLVGDELVGELLLDFLEGELALQDAGLEGGAGLVLGQCDVLLLLLSLILDVIDNLSFSAGFIDFLKGLFFFHLKHPYPIVHLLQLHVFFSLGFLNLA